MVWISDAKYVADYQIHVTFNTGESGTVDLKDVILSDPRAIFRELEDLDEFKKFKVDLDTIVWDNGLDVAPEFLYDSLKQSQHAR